MSETPVSVPAPPQQQADPVNILVVDDQPAKLLSHEAILEPLGERLVKASSGQEALEHLLKNEFAVVLIDVCMPELDGFELASLIREHPRHQRTAIIFVSAVHLTDIDRLRGFECGAVDYVSVPVEPEILRARVSVFADLYRKTKQLEVLNRDLEHLVSERTAELSEAAGRLRESELALLDTARRKDEFLAMLAHELRNPLAPIRNAVEILRQQEENGPETRWSVEVIDRQIAHLTRLVDDLLDVNRITRGKLEVRQERTDVAEILRAAAEGIQPALGPKSLRLNLSLPDGPIPTMADVVRLTQVVLNLLDNACKFTPAGGSIWLSAEREGAGLKIEVRDTGQGIAPEELPRLFQMFYQSRNDTPSYESGLGIGLALVRLIVEMHGGRVHASSPGPGQGSTFTVHLPLVADKRDWLPEPVEPARAAPRRANKVRRILVVDDNEDSAESLAMLLRRYGSEVRTAYDGLAAVQMAQSFQAEVVLLDIGLPLLDGYSAAQRIREQPWGKSLTLIAVTGWGHEHDRQRSREAGFDAHLVKPVNFAAVTRLLDSVATCGRATGRLAGRVGCVPPRARMARRSRRVPPSAGPGPPSSASLQVPGPPDSTVHFILLIDI
jgi:signal transduction histidine kinase